MADLKISALPSATTPLDGTELVPLVQSGTTKKVASSRLGVGPAFSAYADATTQTLADSVYTKVLFQTEEFDTNSNFASSRFTPTVPGYYQINAQILLGLSAITSAQITVYKNGSNWKEGTRMLLAAGSNALVVSSLVYLNGSTDYVEIYVAPNGSAQNILGGGNQQINYFQGSMTRGA
jgi:hypothetical protein